MVKFSNRIIGYLKRKRREYYIKELRTKLNVKEVSIISQNCIGGVFYHDMGLQFLSPTINLFFKSSDYMKFVKNLKYYLSIKPIMYMGEKYPIGKLGDIEVHFMHYSSCEEAKEKWETRKARVLFDKIVVLSTDRDGFNEELFEEWKKLPYKKLMFTSNKRWKQLEGVLYFEKYNQLAEIPDLIENREFYKDDAIFAIINSMKE